MSEKLRPPSLQVSVPKDAPEYSDGGMNHFVVSDGSVQSSSSTPTLRRKRFKMRRMRNVVSEQEGKVRAALALPVRSRSASKEYLQLPSIAITPSSDEDALSSWSNCSTPSASPRRKRFLLKKWLKVREKKEQGSESRLVREPPTPPPTLPYLFPILPNPPFSSSFTSPLLSFPVDPCSVLWLLLHPLICYLTNCPAGWETFPHCILFIF